MSMLQSQLPEGTQQYLEEKNIPALMEHMLHELLLAMPKDPLEFLKNVLSRPMTPKIIIAGPPASGKGTQCELLAKKFGVVRVSTGDLLRDETRRGTPLGKQAQTYMNQGALVPDVLINELVKERLLLPDVMLNGWLLDGFPRTRSQALALQSAGIIPGLVILLDIPGGEAASLPRILGRLVDPETNHIYHEKFNPPPQDVKVEKRADDTESVNTTRWRFYRRNISDVLDRYTHVTVHVDGTQDINSVFETITKEIEARFTE